MVKIVAVTFIVILLVVAGCSFDVEQAVTYYGNKILPSNPEWGNFIFWSLVLIIIFLDNIVNVFRRVKIRIKIKKYPDK